MNHLISRLEFSQLAASKDSLAHVEDKEEELRS